MVLSHWPHVAELVFSVNGSIEKHGHTVGHMCATCVRVCGVSKNVHAHSRTQVQQQVAELVSKAEYKFSNNFGNLLLNLLINMWLV